MCAAVCNARTGNVYAPSLLSTLSNLANAFLFSKTQTDYVTLVPGKLIQQLVNPRDGSAVRDLVNAVHAALKRQTKIPYRLPGRRARDRRSSPGDAKQPGGKGEPALKLLSFARDDENSDVSSSVAERRELAGRYRHTRVRSEFYNSQSGRLLAPIQRPVFCGYRDPSTIPLDQRRSRGNPANVILLYNCREGKGYGRREKGNRKGEWGKVVRVSYLTFSSLFPHSTCCFA